MSGREPISVGDSLAGVVRSLRGPAAAESVQALGGVFGRWREAVGDAVAAHVEPVKLDQGVLVVQVDDPAWATQLRFLESTVLQRLAEVAGAEVERLEIRVRRR